MNTTVESSEFDIQALVSGDRAEFARLVDTYSPHIYRLALKMLQNPQDAEDILQETFIKAHRALPKFEGRSKLSTWLYRIATNEALMFLRKQKSIQISVEQPSEDKDEQAPLEIVDWCCFWWAQSELPTQESTERQPTPQDTDPAWTSADVDLYGFENMGGGVLIFTWS